MSFITQQQPYFWCTLQYSRLQAERKALDPLVSICANSAKKIRQTDGMVDGPERWQICLLGQFQWEAHVWPCNLRELSPSNFPRSLICNTSLHHSQLSLKIYSTYVFFFNKKTQVQRQTQNLNTQCLRPICTKTPESRHKKYIVFLTEPMFEPLTATQGISPVIHTR